MSRLLSAGYSRLWKNKVFWLEMGAVLVYAVVFMLNGCRQAAANGGIGYSLDQFYFHFAVSVGLFGAIFTSLFIGTEYSDGTIRNKFVIGHSRAAVYLSNLLVSGSAMLLMAGVWMLAALIGVPFLGFWKTGAGAAVGRRDAVQQPEPAGNDQRRHGDGGRDEHDGSHAQSELCRRHEARGLYLPDGRLADGPGTADGQSVR